MSLKNDIKDMLESSFDIPFVIEMDHRQQEPCFKVMPADSKEHLFDIFIRFKNQIRLEMVFEPQRYAAQMVREMGQSGADKKRIFCAYAKRLIENGAKVTLKINDLMQDSQDALGWPDRWEKVSVKTDVRPIEFDLKDEPDYINTLRCWLPLMMGLSLSLLNVIPKDVTAEERGTEKHGILEGRKYDVITSRYERSPINRILCLSKYGYSCQICGFDFEKTYGDVGKEFIHVHHIIPVSQMGNGYTVDPEKDLIPVCPNCHAMLHRKTPPLAPETLREMMKEHS